MCVERVCMTVEPIVPNDHYFWFRLITRIEITLSLEEMGNKVGCSASSLCRYKAGRSEPRWSVARKLIALDKHSTTEMRPEAESRD